MQRKVYCIPCKNSKEDPSVHLFSFSFFFFVFCFFLFFLVFFGFFVFFCFFCFVWHQGLRNDFKAAMERVDQEYLAELIKQQVCSHQTKSDKKVNK